MLKKTLVLSAIALIAQMSAAAPAKSITNIADFQQWLEARMLCQKSAYSQDESTAAFGKKMNKLGLVAKMDIDDSGIYSGTVEPGKTSVTVYGFKFRQLFVEGDSGTNFDVQLEASMPDALKLLKDRKLDRYPYQSGDKNTPYMFLTSKPSKQAQVGRDERAIEIRAGESKNTVRINCHQIDW